MAYLTDRFRDAVMALSSNGPIKQRLAKAYAAHLGEIHDDELPPDQRGQFSRLRKRLHQVTPLNGETPVRASVRKMSPAEAAECSKLVVELYTGMLAHELNGQPLHLIDSETSVSVQVPHFLVKT